jgi:Domain of unknown function (DUF4157)
MSMPAATATRTTASPVITSALTAVLQRTCGCGQHTTSGGECDECKKKKIMLERHAAGAGAPAVAPPIVHQVLRSPGQPLDPEIRKFMEPRFRHDFSHVRVHTDDQAAESARAVRAHAYTVGRHLVFASGRYTPQTAKGRSLLGHELTHVVQQSSASDPIAGELRIGEVEDAAEREAAQAEDLHSRQPIAASSVIPPRLQGKWDWKRAGWGTLIGGGIGGAGLAISAAAGAPGFGLGLLAGGLVGGFLIGGLTGKDQQAQQPQQPAQAAGSATIPCGGSGKAASYVPTDQGIDPGTPAAFGTTAKLPASVTFGACKIGESWRFHVTDLVVRIASAVRPENFRINVNTANDPVVTKDAHRSIMADLSPTAEGDDTHRCGGADFPEHITHYSHRHHYWRQQLTVEHEAFHRQDWNDHFRPELTTAESQVWQFALPVSVADSPEAAINQARPTLNSYFSDAYSRTCQAYAPQQETRAYTAGAPAYQSLVDDIQARATREGWDRPAQQQQQQTSGGQTQPQQIPPPATPSPSQNP